MEIKNIENTTIDNKIIDNKIIDNKIIDTNFNVCLIKSKWTLLRIDEFLNKYKGEVGYLRIVLDKFGNETDRTIALLSTELYNNLCEDGLSKYNEEVGFQVSKFILKQKSLPNEYKTRNLFILVPLNYSENFVIKCSTDKLKHLANWDIIPMNSWYIKIPIKSRELGKIKGCCFISFDSNVPIENISMTRILLTDTYWQLQNNKSKSDILRCFWAIDNTKKKDFLNQSSKIKKLSILNELIGKSFNVIQPKLIS